MSAERAALRDDYSIKNGFGFGVDPIADRPVVSQLELKGIELGLGAGTGFALATSMLPVSRVADLHTRVAALKSTQAEINTVGRTAGEQLMQQYLDGTARLAGHRAEHSLSYDFRNWTRFLEPSNLPENVAVDHAAWHTLRGSLQTLDHNNATRLPNAASLDNLAFDTVRREAEMPFLSQLRVPKDWNPTPEISAYNSGVHDFNSGLKAMTAEHEAFKAADLKHLGKIAGALGLAYTIDTELDYSLLRNRSHSMYSYATDIVSPIIGTLLTRKLGYGAPFVVPVAAHLAEKLLFEHRVD
jgi:hypothetical protein